MSAITLFNQDCLRYGSTSQLAQDLLGSLGTPVQVIHIVVVLCAAILFIKKSESKHALILYAACTLLTLQIFVREFLQGQITCSGNDFIISAETGLRLCFNLLFFGLPALFFGVLARTLFYENIEDVDSLLLGILILFSLPTFVLLPLLGSILLFGIGILLPSNKIALLNYKRFIPICLASVVLTLSASY